MKFQADYKIPKHRLKQKDLVMNIFYLFEEEYERSDVECIWDIWLPIEKIKAYLEQACAVHYRGNQWVYTQLKRYEDELGVKLFRRDRTGCKKGSFHLAIHDSMLKFYQKQHLYVAQKIKIANAAYELILNDIAEMERPEPFKVLLGAGSTIFHLANLFAEKSWQDPHHYQIYTHNLVSLKRLLDPNVNYGRIEVFTTSGRIDPVTYTIIGDRSGLYLSTEFDFIMMGTSFVYDGDLYVETAEETKEKRRILKECRGKKILLLTKHEFTDHLETELQPFGTLGDYDFIIVPRFNIKTGIKKKYDLIFEDYRELFTPLIIHWNYAILKLRAAGGD